jgi:hypothetical protein
MGITISLTVSKLWLCDTLFNSLIAKEYFDSVLALSLVWGV